MPPPVSLIDVINHFIKSDTVSLPVFNTNASLIQQQLAKPEPDLKIVEKIINADQALSSQVLKIANSSFYRGLTEVGTVRAAVMRLGMKEIEKIVLLASSKNLYVSKDKTITQVMKKLWQHSVGCAYGTVWLARRYQYGVDQSQAFFAGLFHDVGKLLILIVIEQIKLKNKTLKLTDALLIEAMAKLHTREGAKMLNQWNMPQYFCQVAQEHHSDTFDNKNFLLILVRMANQVCHKLGIGLEHEPNLLLPATLEASLLNLTEIDLAELEIALEDTKVLTN